MSELHPNQADIFSRIRTTYSGLSASFKKVADFLIEHYQDAAFFPAARVAQQAGVSESVVVRFAVYLGYTGFPEMIREVQRHVKAQLSPRAKLEVSTQDLADLQPAEILQACLEQDVENLRATGQEVINQSFSPVVNTLLEAERVYVLGLRGLSHLAGMMAFLLDVAGVRTELITQGDSRLYEQIRYIGPKDCLVVFAFQRYTRRPVDALEIAKAKGARTIAIADAITAPAAQVADLVLRAESKTHSFFNSYVSAVSLVNAVVSTCAMQRRDRAEASMKELEMLMPESDFMTP